MDASQHERDIKLQRVSGDLLAELVNSLPGFLWRSSNENLRHVRRRVKQKDAARLIVLLKSLLSSSLKLEPFQEWPQLLDPHLARILPPLTSAFLDCLVLPAEAVLPSEQCYLSATIPLPRAICRVLYTLCKVRGEKVISRFFNNEPKYLEPLLSAFEAWDVPQVSGRTTQSLGGSLIWEERYIMLLWLSHLLLAPFDLASISSEVSSGVVMSIPGLDLPAGLPSVTNRLLPISLRYLVASGKERESARLLLVRLALRRDMRQLGLLHSLIGWALYNFAPQNNTISSMSIYQHIGILSFLAGVLASADRGTIGVFIMPIFRAVQSVADSVDPLFVEVWSSALARKTMIKIFRLIVTLVLKPKQNTQDPISEAMSSTILEDVVDQMLTALADKDTPVRYAASKALSVIAAQLEGDMAAEVVEAVVGSLGEDVLWEKDSPETEIKATSELTEGSYNASLRRNLNATNPLRWHGLTLTLAHLLFRRSPPPEQLPEILNSLILALGYEQRSATGSSLGTNVRDAACFGIWALSRRYTTKELLDVDTSTISAGRGRAEHMSVPQLLATELVVSASLDPYGNIRRGSSAALQELIGRHPDTVIEGIKVVQVVDYHAVARRSRAITEVAVGASELDQVYWNALFGAMLGWRGTGSPDAESRRVAAKGVGYLLNMQAKITSIFEAADIMVKDIFKELTKIRPREVEERHGLFLALSEIVNTAGHLLRGSPEIQQGLDIRLHTQKDRPTDLFELWKVFGEISPLSEKDLTSSVLRPELTAEAACYLISSLMRESRLTDDSDNSQRPCYLLHGIPEAFLDKCTEIISIAIQRSEDSVVISASLAAKDIFRILDNAKRNQLLRSWIATLNSDICNTLSSAGKSFGHLAALGAVFPYFSIPPLHQSPQYSDEQLSIIDSLILHASTNAQIESRVVAIRSLATGVLGSRVTTSKIIDMLRLALDDYTVDSRGDVGSWVRMEAIDAVSVGWESGALRGESEKRVEDTLISRVARLAVEKLDKVRFKAWKCLRVIQIEPKYSIDLVDDFVDASQTSSYQYFKQLLTYLSISSLRLPTLEGYVTSAGLGSESVLRASRLALVDHLESLDMPAINEDPRPSGVRDICEALLEILKQNVNNDRIAIPALEVISFLFDSRIIQRLQDSPFKWRSLFFLVQKAHFKTGNVLKLSAAIKVYTGLLEIPSVSQDVLARLISMLMHPFPKVRNQVAEVLYLVAVAENLGGETMLAFKQTDWSAPPKNLKTMADILRIHITPAQT